MKFKAVLFDKDGTIFDSERLYCQGWIASAKAFGVEFNETIYQTYIGVRADECYRRAQKRFGDDFPMADFIVFYRDWVTKKQLQGVPFKHGFEVFFEQLLTMDLPIGLVTSSDMVSTNTVFAFYPKYFQAFQVVVTGDMVTQPKPAPEGYLSACQQLGLAPHEVLVFEDSNPGIEAALAAGCMVAAIPDWLAIDERLLAKCDYHFDSFEQAMLILEHTSS